MSEQQEQTPEEKRIDQVIRRGRLLKGVGSTIATTIIVSTLWQKIFKEDMDANFAIALATALGSIGTWFVMCFKDFRALFCGYLIRKRIVRNRRRHIP